jgi:hypothetical protein
MHRRLPTRRVADATGQLRYPMLHPAAVRHGTSSPRCRTVCLRVQFRSLMGNAMDHPEPYTPRQARATGQRAESRSKPCVRHLRQSGLLSQHRIGRQPFSG